MLKLKQSSSLHLPTKRKWLHYQGSVLLGLNTPVWPKSSCLNPVNKSEIRKSSSPGSGLSWKFGHRGVGWGGGGGPFFLAHSPMSSSALLSAVLITSRKSIRRINSCIDPPKSNYPPKQGIKFLDRPQKFYFLLQSEITKFIYMTEKIRTINNDLWHSYPKTIIAFQSGPVVLETHYIRESKMNEQDDILPRCSISFSRSAPEKYDISKS